MFTPFMPIIIKIIQLTLTRIKLMNIMTFQRNPGITLIHFHCEFILNMLYR